MVKIARWPIFMCAWLALPVIGFAQEATLGGSVTDSTGAVLPGVTVTAVHEATGNKFEAVTDARGAYRLAVRTGRYRITAQLEGFSTVTRSGFEVLVGQQAVANFQLAPSAIQETVTVIGEAPLVDTTQSRTAGNINPRQMQELPVNGRNWQDLTLLAPGSRANLGGDTASPLPGGEFQLNLDGQQITDTISKGNTAVIAKFSRDAIAEFEFVTNRFDATQGRSAGVQVNAITKSGTNTPSGTFAGYFRDDRFNAADFVTNRVLPYSNQQLSGTFGGPIRKDRVHFFVSYEFGREPQTGTFTSIYPLFNIDQAATRRDQRESVRVDVQLSPRTRFTVRQNYWRNSAGANNTGSTIHPAGAGISEQNSGQFYGALSQVLGRAVNEVKIAYHTSRFATTPNILKPDSRLPGATVGAPLIRFRSYTVGSSGFATQTDVAQKTPSIRDDLSFSFTQRGLHYVRTGGEYLNDSSHVYSCRSCSGIIDATGGPTPANIEALFPVWNDTSTWNLAALAPITVSYSVGIGNFHYVTPRNVFAAWMQDDWQLTPHLTLNLGVRYDLTTNQFANNVVIEPFLPPGRGIDKKNVVPRLGFVYSLNDRTVLRGGAGKFFADSPFQQNNTSLAFSISAQALVLNDHRPDFVTNPFNGPTPTYEQVVATGVRNFSESPMASQHMQTPYSYQASVGVQRQLGQTMSVDADYVYTGTRHQTAPENNNLSYNPVTGVNYPWTDASKRPFPNFGIVDQQNTEARSNYHGLQTAFTKRFTQGWQASASYLLSGYWDEIPGPFTLDATGRAIPVPFKVAPDMGGEYTLGANDQRHRVSFNGIWQLKYGFQLSTIYLFGSGLRYGTFYGGDLRLQGTQPDLAAVPTGQGRLRPDGTIVPRNSFVGDPVHKVDLRLQRTFQLAGRVHVDGIFEAFNVFNHKNYGSYTTQENTGRYGRPNTSFPRVLQLGFRFAF